MDKIEIKLKKITGLKAAYKAVGKPYGNNGGPDLLYKVSKILKHESVLEHIYFTFNVLGSSLLEQQEHIRHRISISDINYPNDFIVNPINLEYESTDVYAFIQKYTVMPLHLQELSADEFERIVKARSFMFKEFFLLYKQGFIKEAFKALPESIRVNSTWTINLRSMLNFIDLRTAKGAHFEIRHIAGKMYDLLCENKEIKDLIKTKEKSV
jgi:thymidylate synthase (FAD)